MNKIFNFLFFTTFCFGSLFASNIEFNADKTSFDTKNKFLLLEGNVSLKIENFMDVFLELGIKATDIENQTSFSESDTQANVIAGLRFGDSNGWEGKVYVDFSKETEIVQQECPPNLVCTAFEASQVNYVLDDETDQKFGFVATYNASKRSALVIETSTSKVTDNIFKIGYQLNF